MKYLFLLFCFLLCLSAFTQQKRYNENYQIACHNCYGPKLATNITDVLAYTSTIEIDIWDNFQGSGILSAGNKMNGDWYVKHDIFQKGNANCCGGSFADCLKRLKVWSDHNPTHKVITVFIDKKENWSDSGESRKPSDFDQLIETIFSKSSIYTPSDLLGNKKSLKEAALSNWANIDMLKGKFIFVITDGTEITNRKPLNEYLNSQKHVAICFIAPQISIENELIFIPRLTLENAENVVFYNLEYPSELSEKIASLNCLSRIFNSPETIEAYNLLVNKKVNFIAIDNYRLLQ